MLKFIINLENDIKREVLIKEGLVIGRSKGDIIIPDNQISSTHAIIKSNKEGHFFLKDMSSTNGIVIGGERVAEALLVPGIQILLGNTLVHVAESTADLAQAGEEKEKESTLLLNQMSFSDSEEKNSLLAFEVPVQIDFIRGPLNKNSWKLFWGPVKIGTKPGSYSIIDTDVKKGLDLFEISKTTQSKSTFLRNLGIVDIKINGTFLEKTGLLENGDLVEFANTAFKIKT